MIPTVFCFRKKMWSSVTAAGTENGPAPPSRSKHSATLLAGHVYLLGGRNGNLPLKDLWRYSLGEPLNFYACMWARAYCINRYINRAFRYQGITRSVIRYLENVENPDNYRGSGMAVTRVVPSARYNMNDVSDQRSAPHHIHRRTPWSEGARRNLNGVQSDQ